MKKFQKFKSRQRDIFEIEGAEEKLSETKFELFPELGGEAFQVAKKTSKARGKRVQVFEVKDLSISQIKVFEP